MNQTIEQYLHIYCNYQQDNWTNLLSLAEFAYNNAHQPTIDCSPFYANFGFHPKFTINLCSPSTSVPATKALAETLQSHHSDLIESIKSAQNHQACYYDANRVGKEPSRLGEPDEPGGASPAKPTISDWRAERVRVLARSLGSPSCSIHFIPNSLRMLQLYDTKFVAYRFQIFNQSNMSHEKCCVYFLYPYGCAIG